MGAPRRAAAARKSRAVYNLKRVGTSRGYPMARLFSYTIPVDDWAAPNPFHDICTLASSKPTIRRVAKPGDWIAGLVSYHITLEQNGYDLATSRLRESERCALP